MTRDPLAGVQTALEECRDFFTGQVKEAEVLGFFVFGSIEHRLLAEVEVGLTLLREVRERKAA